MMDSLVELTDEERGWIVERFTARVTALAAAGVFNPDRARQAADLQAKIDRINAGAGIAPRGVPPADWRIPDPSASEIPPADDPSLVGGLDRL